MAVFESGQDEELYAGRDMWLRKGEKGYKLISAAGVQKAILSNGIRDEDLEYIKNTIPNFIINFEIGAYNLIKAIKNNRDSTVQVCAVLSSGNTAQILMR